MTYCTPKYILYLASHGQTLLLQRLLDELSPQLNLPALEPSRVWLCGGELHVLYVDTKLPLVPRKTISTGVRHLLTKYTNDPLSSVEIKKVERAILVLYSVW